MVQNSAVGNFDLKKEQLEKDLAEALLTAGATNQIDLAEFHSIAQDVVLELEALSGENGMTPFLEKIIQKWPFFSTVKNKSQQQGQRQEEQVIINKLSNYIKTQN